MSNEKNWLFSDIGKYTTQLCGDYSRTIVSVFVSNPINQPA